MVSKAVNGLTAFLVLILGVALVFQFGPLGTPSTADTFTNTTVTLADANGTALATVSVRVANDRSERYTGLSTTGSLDPGEGMLFVHPEEGSYGYVMRDMAFPLDIVFVAANGTITTIHEAPTEPGESGSQLTKYRGRGKYVLEVPRGYTNATGVEVGDTVEIPDGVEADDDPGWL
jgi:uncharacterized membrane protein (UPF0127 family)